MCMETISNAKMDGAAATPESYSLAEDGGRRIAGQDYYRYSWLTQSERIFGIFRDGCCERFPGGEPFVERHDDTDLLGLDLGTRVAAPAVGDYCRWSGETDGRMRGAGR